MRRITLHLLSALACVLPLAGGASALADNSSSPPSTSPPATPPANPARYVNPFADAHWIAGRIDMGIDWVPLRRLPVVAVGNGVVLGADDHSGWPGGHLIWYQLTDGPLQGDVIYVAEHLTKLARVGTTVRAGQRVATAVPGYPYIETGWADASGSPRAYPCYHEGHATNSGQEMARFLSTLGASLGLHLRRGAAQPAGRLC